MHGCWLFVRNMTEISHFIVQCTLPDCPVFRSQLFKFFRLTKSSNCDFVISNRSTFICNDVEPEETGAHAKAPTSATKRSRW